MDKASEKELAGLHGVVAKTLREQLEATAVVMNEDGEEVAMSMATPQVLAQAIKFLKDNNITASIEQGDDMDALKEALANKPKRGRAKLSSVPAAKAAGEE